MKTAFRFTGLLAICSLFSISGEARVKRSSPGVSMDSIQYSSRSIHDGGRLEVTAVLRSEITKGQPQSCRMSLRSHYSDQNQFETDVPNQGCTVTQINPGFYQIKAIYEFGKQAVDRAYQVKRLEANLMTASGVENIWTRNTNSAEYVKVTSSSIVNASKAAMLGVRTTSGTYKLKTGDLLVIDLDSREDAAALLEGSLSYMYGRKDCIAKLPLSAGCPAGFGQVDFTLGGAKGEDSLKLLKVEQIFDTKSYAGGAPVSDSKVRLTFQIPDFKEIGRSEGIEVNAIQLTSAKYTNAGLQNVLVHNNWFFHPNPEVQNPLFDLE